MINILKRIITIILFAITVFCFTFSGMQIWDSYYISSTNNGCYIPIEEEGKIEDRRILEVKKQLTLVPEEIQTAFQESGWNFIVTDKNLNHAYFDGKYNRVNGVTVSSEESIYIFDHFHSTHVAPIHEIGHWFDIQHNVISKTEGFLNIYEKEKNLLLNEFEVDVSNEMEFFAEGFQCYLKHPERLEKHTPLLYAYMKTEIQSYNQKES